MVPEDTLSPFACMSIMLALSMAAGELSLVLDFGSFVLDSDNSAASLEEAEEAPLYMFFRLVGRNISAHLVDGAFDWEVFTKEGGGGPAARGGALVPPCYRALFKLSFCSAAVGGFPGNCTRDTSDMWLQAHSPFASKKYKRHVPICLLA